MPCMKIKEAKSIILKVWSAIDFVVAEKLIILITNNSKTSYVANDLKNGEKEN